MMIALVLALAPQDVGDLVRRLGDESVDVRSTAEAALRERGRAVVPALRKVAAGHPDPEVRGRAEALVRAITQIRWHTDLAEARKRAVAENKPLLVFSTMGPLDGFV